MTWAFYRTAGRYILVYGVALIVLLPFLWVVLSAFKSEAELLRYPPLIRRELVTNLLAYPGQDRELVSFVRGLVMAELDPTVVVEIELLETFKRNRMSMLDVRSNLQRRASA